MGNECDQRNNACAFVFVTIMIYFFGRRAYYIITVAKLIVLVNIRV
jgi:hypothetical protein